MYVDLDVWRREAVLGVCLTDLDVILALIQM